MNEMAEVGPTILTGDLNAKPDAPEIQPLYDVLVDAWWAAGQGTGLTAYQPVADRRID